MACITPHSSILSSRHRVATAARLRPQEGALRRDGKWCQSGTKGRPSQLESRASQAGRPADVGSSAQPGRLGRPFPARRQRAGQVQALTPLQAKEASLQEAVGQDEASLQEAECQDEAALEEARGHAARDGETPEHAGAAEELPGLASPRAQAGGDAGSSAGDERALSREEIAHEVARR